MKPGKTDYCPRCRKEQRCGCDTCHSCGAPLVETPVESPPRVRETGQTLKEAEDRIKKPAGDGTIHDVGSRHGRGITGRSIRQRLGIPDYLEHVLPTILLVMGFGILLLSVIEIIGTVAEYSWRGEAAVGIFRRIGYYMGHPLYRSCIHLLAGFAITAAGFLLEPPGPFRRWSSWARVALWIGVALGFFSACYILSAILVLMPGPLILLEENLLPNLAIAVPVFVVSGAFMAVCSYLLISGSVERAAGGTTDLQ